MKEKRASRESLLKAAYNLKRAVIAGSSEKALLIILDSLKNNGKNIAKPLDLVI